MFEHLKAYKRIVVSGPQRSGTRIVAKAVAQDTNKSFIDEVDIAVHDFRLLEWFLGKDDVVIQCPSLCHKLHEINSPDTFIILVRRPVDDIIKSQVRIGWVEERVELYKYGYSTGIISRIKYEFWDTYQKDVLDYRCGEFSYNDLESHPLFIRERGMFAWNQTC